MTTLKTEENPQNGKENKKMMETSEKQLKRDGNERKRGDLRIHMKVQQIETNMQEMRQKRTETKENTSKSNKNDEK